VAEDLALNQRFRNGRAVDRDKWPRFARAQIVQGARHQLLAGAALAGDEHGDIGGRNLLDQPEDLPHLLPGAAHQRAQHAGLAQAPARHFQLDLGLALAGGVGQNGAQARRVHRLLQKVVGAQLHGVHGQFDGAHGGEHHHGQIGVEPEPSSASLVSRPMPSSRGIFRSVTTMAGFPGQRLLPALDAVARGLGAVSPAGDQLGEPHQRVGLVFDNQDFDSYFYFIPEPFYTP
jgi:hypothetical protein